MDFKNEIQKLSLQICERKSHVTNEEMTKQALIIPFLQKLGFDVFNPLEVRPEYDADFGKKKGEKVDYAIFKNNVPIIFIEAKSVNEPLAKHDAQLSRYFNATPEVKVAILTNGIEYKFYTDLTQDNIMDNEPFYSFSMEVLSNVDLETIESFTKEKFNADRILKYAEELVYMSNLNSTLKELFKNPSDDFLRFLIKDFSNTRITNNVLERFRPIVKKAISNTLLEIISEGLSPKELVQQEVAVSTAEIVEQEAVSEEPSSRSNVITTEDELKAYELVLNILKKNSRDISQVQSKDTTNYYAIYKRVSTSWFIRLTLDENKKMVTTKLSPDRVSELHPELTVTEAPKGYGASRILLDSLDDLVKITPLILLAYDEADTRI